DILISGGGVAGLTAAAAFGSAGFRVICVDPAPPVTEEAEAGADLRTTAFLQPSRQVLEAAGLWDRIAPHGAALRIMRIVDAGGERPEPRIVKDFDAAEIGEEPFGWNFPNWLLRRETVARLGLLPNVAFRPGVGTRAVFTRPREARVTLSGGGPASCRRRRPGEPGARGRGHRRQDLPLRSEGARLRRHAPDPARQCLDRDPSLGGALHSGAAARPAGPSLLRRRLDGAGPRGAAA